MRHLAAALLLALTACLDLRAEGDIKWLSTVHDFGAFAESDTLATTRFQFVNLTDRPVAITSVLATCGCTTPTYPTSSILPGDTATISVSYDSEGRPGRFSKKIYVRTTASDTRTGLIIKGVVMGNENSVRARFPMEAGKLRLRSGAVMLGKVKKGRAKMETLQGYNRNPDSITPMVEYSPDWIDVGVIPPRVGPGEQMQFNVYFRSDKCPQWGLSNDSIIVIPDFNEAPVTIPVIAIVEEDFLRLSPGEMQNAPMARLSTERVDLGHVASEHPQQLSATLTLTNTGKSTLKVRRVYTDDRGLDVSIKDTSIKKGKSAEISVTVSPGHTDVINKRFTIITNDPVNPTQIVRVVGTIAP